jgi:hypothetical protein
MDLVILSMHGYPAPASLLLQVQVSFTPPTAASYQGELELQVRRSMIIMVSACWPAP